MSVFKQLIKNNRCSSFPYLIHWLSSKTIMECLVFFNISFRLSMHLIKEQILSFFKENFIVLRDKCCTCSRIFFLICFYPVFYDSTLRKSTSFVLILLLIYNTLKYTKIEFCLKRVLLKHLLQKRTKQTLLHWKSPNSERSTTSFYHKKFIWKCIFYFWHVVNIRKLKEIARKEHVNVFFNCK